jgi:hypothetical protein
MAASAPKPSSPITDPSDASVLDELAAVDALVARDAEAQRVASEVAADIQALLAHAIATGQVEELERIRRELNVASFDEAMNIARKRAATR